MWSIFWEIGDLRNEVITNIQMITYKYRLNLIYKHNMRLSSKYVTCLGLVIDTFASKPRFEGSEPGQWPIQSLLCAVVIQWFCSPHPPAPKQKQVNHLYCIWAKAESQQMYWSLVSRRLLSLCCTTKLWKQIFFIPPRLIHGSEFYISFFFQKTCIK